MAIGRLIELSSLYQMGRFVHLVDIRAGSDLRLVRWVTLLLRTGFPPRVSLKCLHSCLVVLCWCAFPMMTWMLVLPSINCNKQLA